MQQVLWIDIIFMVSSLAGDDVIEIKKKKFNKLERRLLFVMRIILGVMLISIMIKAIYLNIYCKDNPMILTLDYLSYAHMVTLAIIGGLFINKVKNLRSDTWKK